MRKKYTPAVLCFIAVLGTSLSLTAIGSTSAEAKPSRKEIIEARRVLKNVKSGKIKLMVVPPYGKRDQKAWTTAGRNIVSVARGQEAKTTRNCDNRHTSETPGPYKDVRIKLRVLKFMNALAREMNYSVTSLVGQCHSPNSSHYYGEAIDIGCQVNKLSSSQIRRAVQIANTYGMAKNWENCSASGGYHHHFSIKH